MFGMKRRARELAEIENHLAEERVKRQKFLDDWKARIVDGRLDVTAAEFQTLISTNVLSRLWWPLSQYLGVGSIIDTYIDGKLWVKPKTHEERRTEAAERAAAALEKLAEKAS